jgi:TetR/AcrR family transcriptional regulator, transcriptional repressor for nem operon
MNQALFVPRTKEFERDEALQAATKQFADHGFEGTSTDMLLAAMGISRQSLYDTFGDKRQLYLTALTEYARSNVGGLIRTMNTAASPRKGIEAAFLQFAARPPREGCLGVSSICEFGRSDEAVTRCNAGAGAVLLGAFERRLADAKLLGEVAAELDVHEAAQFLVATLSGLKVSARGGTPPKTLRAIALMALRSLG